MLLKRVGVESVTVVGVFVFDVDVDEEAVEEEDEDEFVSEAVEEVDGEMVTVGG